MRILAAVSRSAAEPFAIESVDLDTPREDELLVKIVASGICHTDLVFKGMRRTGARPSVLGHEGAGVVEQVGSAVADIRPGDHVLLSYGQCGVCERCTAGRPAYCAQSPGSNMTGKRADGSSPVHQDGSPVFASFVGQSSFAQYAIVRARNAVVVDPEVDLVTAAPLSCGILTGAGATLNVLRPGADSRMVVYGVGAVGLAALMAARTAGVAQLIAVDPVPGRRALAEKLGATDTLDPTGIDVATAIAELTGGGATHAVDTSGVPKVVADGVRGLTSGGTMVAVGLGAPMAEINLADLLLNGKTLRGSAIGDADAAEFIPTLLDLHREGRFPVEELITTYEPGDINQAVADSLSGATVKPVLVW